MRVAQTKEIGGLAYKVVPCGARTGKAVLLLLTAAAGKAFKGFKLEGLEPDAGTVAGLLLELVGHLTDADVDFMIEAFAPMSSVTLENGKQPQLTTLWDEHFAGRYAELTEWLAFCLEVNYSGFFGELLRAKRPAPAPGAPASE